MSAALALSALAAVGGELRADGRRLRLLARGPLPAELRAAVRAAAPALLRVASDQWRTEMAAWPVSWVDLWNECAGRRQDSGEPVDLAERLAFFDVLEADERGELADDYDQAGAELAQGLETEIRLASEAGAPAPGTPGQADLCPDTHARAPESLPWHPPTSLAAALARWDREAAAWRAYLSGIEHPPGEVLAVLHDALGPRPTSDLTRSP